MSFVKECNKFFVSLKTQQDGNRTDGRTTRNGNRERGTGNGRQQGYRLQATGLQDTGGKKPKKTAEIFEIRPPTLDLKSVFLFGSALAMWYSIQHL